MVLTIIAFLVWQGIKAYFFILSWIVTTWARIVWMVHWWYVKGMAYVLDRTSPQSPQLREPNGNKRRAIEMEEQIPETSREQLAVITPSLEYDRQKEATVSPGYVFSNSFKLGAFAACIEAVENLRGREALIGVHDEELIQMLCTIVRGGRDLYSMRIPWPMMSVKEGGEGRGMISGVDGVNGSVRSPVETTDWESIYSKYRPKSRGGAEGEKEGTSDAAKPRAKSPEYVDNLNKIHTSLASLHAIVEKTNAEKEELKKIQSSSSVASPPNSVICSKEGERKVKKEEEEEISSREKEKIEKRKDVKEKKEAGTSSKKNRSVDDLFDDGSENEEEIRGSMPPSAKRRKEETRQEKKMRKDEERKKKKGGEDEFLSSDEDEAERKEREKEKRREEREREKREAIMSISGCYSVKNNEKEDREREREKAREMERERARRDAKEEEERERLKEKAIEKERREEEKRKEEEKRREEEKRKEEEKKKERSVLASPAVLSTRKMNKKCTCSPPFPDLDELNEKFDSEYRTIEECGGNWTDIKLHDVVATLRNGRWVRARVNETRADGLYLGLESSTGSGFSGRVKECTGCIHINKIVAIEKD